MATLKRTFASGLIVLLPIGITVFVLSVLFGLIASVPPFSVLEPPALRVAVTLATLGALFLVVGRVSRSLLGAVVTSVMDGAAARVPGLRVVYSGSKTALETSVQNRSQVRAVKVELWDDAIATGFVAQDEPVDGTMTVFVPMAPPTAVSGFVLAVDENDIIETDESLERAAIRVVSAGFAG